MNTQISQLHNQMQALEGQRHVMEERSFPYSDPRLEKYHVRLGKKLREQKEAEERRTIKY